MAQGVAHELCVELLLALYEVVLDGGRERRGDLALRHVALGLELSPLRKRKKRG